MVIWVWAQPAVRKIYYALVQVTYNCRTFFGKAGGDLLSCPEYLHKLARRQGWAVSVRSSSLLGLLDVVEMGFCLLGEGDSVTDFGVFSCFCTVRTLWPDGWLICLSQPECWLVSRLLLFSWLRPLLLGRVLIYGGPLAIVQSAEVWLLYFLLLPEASGVHSHSCRAWSHSGSVGVVLRRL